MIPALWQRLRRLSPVAQGFGGALLVLVLYLGITWTAQRWREFVIMRNVVDQILQNSQKAAATQAKPPEATNVPR